MSFMRFANDCSPTPVVIYGSSWPEFAPARPRRAACWGKSRNGRRRRPRASRTVAADPLRGPLNLGVRRVRMAAMDLRIVAIALSRGLVLRATCSPGARASLALDDIAHGAARGDHGQDVLLIRDQDVEHVRAGVGDHL